MLTLYTTRLQTILHDYNLSFYGSPLNITSIINQARDKVAIDGQCVRVLPSSSGSVSAIAVGAGGTGYTTPPTVSITAPDLTVGGIQATATATLSGNSVNAVSISNAGAGYISPPIISFSGGGGSGATATATLTSFVQTTLNQEVYNFSAFTSLAQAANSGVNYIHQINSIAVSQGNVKPVLYYVDWPLFQGWCRINEGFVQNYPCAWSQYGTGQYGSFYLYPVPSGNYSMDLDCFCVPIDLVNDSTAEAIPYPFTEAVPYYAAYLCYEYAQREEDADKMFAKYQAKMSAARAEANTTRIPDIYEDGEDW